MKLRGPDQQWNECPCLPFQAWNSLGYKRVHAVSMERVADEEQTTGHGDEQDLEGTSGALAPSQCLH